MKRLLILFARSKKQDIYVPSRGNTTNISESNRLFRITIARETVLSPFYAFSNTWLTIILNGLKSEREFQNIFFSIYKQTGSYEMRVYFCSLKKKKGDFFLVYSFIILFYDRLREKLKTTHTLNWKCSTIVFPISRCGRVSQSRLGARR